jgi:hypothetical protein
MHQQSDWSPKRPGHDNITEILSSFDKHFCCQLVDNKSAAQISFKVVVARRAEIGRLELRGIRTLRGAQHKGWQ